MHPTAIAKRLTVAMEAIKADIVEIKAGIELIQDHLSIPRATPAPGNGTAATTPTDPLPPARMLADALTRKPR